MFQFQGRLKGVLKEVLRVFKDVLRMFHESFLVYLRVFHGREISRMFQGCFMIKGASSQSVLRKF